MKKKFVFLCRCSFLWVNFILGQDIEGAQDHQLINRYPNSRIVDYYFAEYDEINVATKSAIAEEEPQEFLTLQGKRTALVYQAPDQIMPIAIMKNYRDAILNKGGEILFECRGGSCDGTATWYKAKFFNTVYVKSQRTASTGSFYFPFDDFRANQEYLVAKVTTRDAEYYIEIGTIKRSDDEPTKICLEIIQKELIKTDLIEVNADVIKEQMDKNGKIALYGIYFDTGKATIKPTSFKEIEAIGQYLNNNPEVSIYIIGHTDDVGSLDNNLILSDERAAAVSAALLNNFGDFGMRLTPKGVGPYCPVMTNETEEGRKKNRRVEIVKKLK